jgi:thioredoxin:protein disulfide reductase
MRLLFLLLMFSLPLGPAGAGEQNEGLRELLGGSRPEEEPLPPERAFVMQAEALAHDAVGLTFTPAPTYYLYRSKFAFAVDAQGSGAVAIKDVQLPEGEMKEDPIFGRTEVYHDSVRALVSLAPAGSTTTLPQEVALKVTMQGCTERGLCYPPDTRQVSVKLAAAPGASMSDAGGAAAHTLATAAGAAPAKEDKASADASNAASNADASRFRQAAVFVLLATLGVLLGVLWWTRRGK